MERRLQILLIGQEGVVRRLLPDKISFGFHTCFEAHNAEAAWDLYYRERPSVILFALGGVDWLSLIRDMRRLTHASVITIAECGDAEVVKASSGVGAHYNFFAPIKAEELRSCFDDAVRRGRPGGEDGAIFCSGPLRLDLANQRLFLAEKEIHLTPKEYALLRYLTSYAGRVVTHRQILDELWGGSIWGAIIMFARWCVH